MSTTRNLKSYILEFSVSFIIVFVVYYLIDKGTTFPFDGRIANSAFRAFLISAPMSIVMFFVEKYYKRKEKT